MRKFFWFALLTIFFASCSSNGSRELQIDEMTYSSYTNCASAEEFNPDEYTKQMSVFDIVPGSYTLSWTLVDDLPQVQNYNIALKLKLRLKRHVDVNQEFIDKQVNGNDPEGISSFQFVLLDENGKYVPIGSVQHFNIYYNESLDFDKDQCLEFLRFLQAEPGAEIELNLYTIGVKSAYANCIDECKNAKGIICILDHNDKYFESHYGIIN